MKTLFTAAALLWSILTTAQPCTCESNFEWTRKTFEENDAGFQYAVDVKGRVAYDAHTATSRQKAEAARNFTECQQVLREWLQFFRAGHIGITSLVKAEPAPAKAAVADSVWPRVTVDTVAFRKAVATQKTAGYEGVWETPPYTVGIRREGTGYVGFILQSGLEEWKPGQVKLRIRTASGKSSATFYVRDHSAVESDDVNLLGNNYLVIGRFRMKRVSPVFPADKSIDDYFRLMAATKPSIEAVNSTTMLLRIPSFDALFRPALDSLLDAHWAKLTSTENLIIDLRGNGGGSDGTFAKLMTLLYTNPVRVVGMELRSTKLNNQRMLDFIAKPEYGLDSAEKVWARESYGKLEKRLGEFVDLDTIAVSVDTPEKMYANPKSVAILIHQANGSTTEQFLLAAKQSKKVKLFGTSTGGVLDISNMYSVTSPCKEFELDYSLSRSLRIPDMTIDGKGIQPDYYLDKSIPSYRWVEHASEVLNAR